MWEAIRVTNKGIENVRLRKVSIFQKHYELFSMKENKTTYEMFGIFQTILIGLKSLGTKFSKAQNNLKILYSLPKFWEPKTMIIL
uniref:Retrovirus-related Pol polyprotein from transposon TNT 1-94 n=1 Tax=Cajanus cajan TaxID=3821 RepID=A0A151S1W5_CAJCA|nr:hypothetical protein KK1_029532 [Cajanus cajan]